MYFIFAYLVMNFPVANSITALLFDFLIALHYHTLEYNFASMLFIYRDFIIAVLVQ